MTQKHFASPELRSAILEGFERGFDTRIMSQAFGLPEHLIERQLHVVLEMRREQAEAAE